MVRSAFFFVLACLLALTVEGLLWSSSHSGGAVEEPCRFAQVQVSSSELYRLSMGVLFTCEGALTVAAR